MSFVEELRQGLEKTRKNFTERMEDLVGISVDLDEDFMDELENDPRCRRRRHQDDGKRSCRP